MVVTKICLPEMWVPCLFCFIWSRSTVAIPATKVPALGAFPLREEDSQHTNKLTNKQGHIRHGQDKVEWEWPESGWGDFRWRVL